MEFSILAAWFNKFLLIVGGFLILSLLFLFTSNKKTKKLDQMKQNNEKNNE